MTIQTSGRFYLYSGLQAQIQKIRKTELYSFECEILLSRIQSS